MKTGLLGKSLSHSFSPLVHQQFGNADYQLFETDDPIKWLKTEQFLGINVTIPYKSTLLKSLDFLDQMVQKTGSLNCIVNRNGRLLGYNTDVNGFIRMLSYYQVNPYGKQVVLIGNGGASRSVRQVFRDLGAQTVVTLCRQIRDEGDRLFSEMMNFQDADILVNTTPVGMYPDSNAEFLLTLDAFPKANIIIDLIYNPLNTRLLQRASELGRQAINGLYLLVAQAKRSHELFYDTSLSDDEIARVYLLLRQELTNIVFIGLPLSGKSLYGKKLAEITKRSLIDTDDAIEQATQLTIPDLFTKYGETYFRQKEFEVISTFTPRHGLILACGGGVVTNWNLIQRLKQNGVIVFLDKDPQAIASRKIHNRPLLQTATDIFRLAEVRQPLYQKAADIIIKIHPNRHDQLPEIEEIIHEYFSH